MLYNSIQDILTIVQPILEVTSDAICILNLNNEKIFSNKAYELMIRRSKKEVVSDSSKIYKNNNLIGTVVVYHDISEINRLKKELDKVNQRLRKVESKYTFKDIVGKNPKLLHTIKIAKGAALTPATIMIRGESGTGKEIFAHAIHNSSTRRHQKFVKVNCSSIPENLLESELFGYKDGAFTGAMRGGKKGLFQEAHRGTLFLDEVGDVSPRMQVKILRVLQEKEIMPIGSTENIKVDVRIICATNKHLEEMVDEGKFREDLYYRLNVFPIFIPPLRKRLEDIKDISLYLINKYNEIYNRNVNEIEESAVDLLKSQTWRGNVRELENFLSRIMINMDERDVIIKSKHVSDIFQEMNISVDSRKNNLSLHNKKIKLKDILNEVEEKCIKDAIERNNGDKNKAAFELDIPLRTLYYRCKKLNL